LTDAFWRRFPRTELTLHFHDSRGMALANVIAGLTAGVTRFDASLGGLGGCPYAPGASGNACLEDMAQMLELCGHETGVDLDALTACARAAGVGGPRRAEPERQGRPPSATAPAAGRLRFDSPARARALNQEPAMSKLSYRIGQIVPSSNTTMETGIPAMLGAREAIERERFACHSSRMRMKQVTKEGLAATDADRGRCALELSDAQVDLLGYACQVAIMSMGRA